MAMQLVYENEKKLFSLMLGLAALVWVLALAGTGGAVILYVVFGFLFYCFAQSALISTIKGNGVRITEEQFPDLKRQIDACCRKLGQDVEPQAYLLQMGGALNAFATRFFGRDFLVLYSDVVDGLAHNPDALNFYIGHEIGHIKRKHLAWSTVLLPAAWLPLVGPAYARAREYTCDRHGVAACDDPVNAEQGLAVLAAGGRRARTLNLQAYVDQSRHSEGFWMSFHELVGDYPWLVKRMAAVRALAAGEPVRQPARNKLAGVLALFVPRLGLGGGSGIVVALAMLGVLAGVAVPAYERYVQKSQLALAYLAGNDASAKVGAYYMENKALPASLTEAGAQVVPGGPIESVHFDRDSGRLQVVSRIAAAEGSGTLVFTPSLDRDKRVVWQCAAEHLAADVVPSECR
jgi:Zn-dependent protease with chaperone function/Tfp pilus assembly major pilin PilA